MFRRIQKKKKHLEKFNVIVVEVFKIQTKDFNIHADNEPVTYGDSGSAPYSF